MPLPRTGPIGYSRAMALLEDSAVVLRRLDYSETSQIAVLFTHHHGKVRVIAKGSKRGTKQRFATGLEPLELGEAAWSARPDRDQSLSTLTDWHPQRAFSGLRESLPRLYAAEYGAEITAGLTEDADPHPELFEHLVAFLGAVEEAGEPLVELGRFQRRLLHEVGLLPQFQQCAGCRRSVGLEHLLYFSSGQGGLLCRDCEPPEVEKRRIAPGVAEALASGRIEAAPEGVFDLLNYHIACILRREPRLASFVRPGPGRPGRPGPRPA